MTKSSSYESDQTIAMDTLNDQSQYAIICSKLTKVYDSKIAVDHIDLKIRYGSIFGLLGPNGAGKTTVIKMLSGLSDPTEGNAYVAGYNVAKESLKVKENIGWVASEVILDDSLTSMENIWIQSKLHDIGKNWKQKAVALMKYFELDESDNKKVGHFSTGMRKKLEIIMALLHEPKVLFMDEPTIGLDANTRRLLWSLIKKINKSYGVTILLTTHYIEEADVLCDNLAIINHGKIIANGSPQQLKSTVGGDIVEIEFFSNFDFSTIKNIDGVKTIRHEMIGAEKEKEEEEDEKNEQETRLENSLKLFIKVNNAETALPSLISTITRLQPHNIKSIRIEKPNLESIFLELTGMRFNEAEEHADKQFYTKIKRLSLSNFRKKKKKERKA
ncbi:MAG: ATP-binding cassette domain-containing protein [Thermoproteota archaeon]|nr:ATP-binding cassette domain-containing protein [Thermoproteota archaeon]